MKDMKDIMNLKKTKIKAYTDYPFTQLGDIPGQSAPIREIEVISYDGGLYCEIIVDDISEYIKNGYIYQESGLFGAVPCITKEQLDSLPKTKL